MIPPLLRRPLAATVAGWALVGAASVAAAASGAASGGAMPSRSSPAPAAASCAPPTRWLERVVPADCERCWAGTPADAVPPTTLAIDWIAPAGDTAPLAAAALAEAAERPGAPLAASGASGASGAANRAEPLPRRRAAHLRVEHGPAVHGYMAVRMKVERAGPWRADARAWLALVEAVPAGSEGSTLARRLVRAVAGPLPLDALRTRRVVEHLQAMRLPEGARAERLSAVGWLESAEGRVVAAGSSAADCR